jgi:Fe-S cluster biogenesis protein NfuA
VEFSVTSDDGGFVQRMERVEDLLGQAECFADPVARTVTRDVVGALLELHGAGLARMLDVLAGSGDIGRSVMQALLADGLITSLLLLHGLHPVDLESRVLMALETVKPTLAQHGGGVEFLGIEEGVVRLKLEGNCNGCPSSGETLRNLVEAALDELAPDRAGLEVTAAEPLPSRLISLPMLTEVAAGEQG